MNNSLSTATSKPRFSVVLQSDAMKNLINNTLGDKDKAQRFVASISSAVAQNPALQDCDAKTIVSAGLVGEALNLSPSSFMGQYYLVPFNDRKNNRTVAQFQIGYKGYIQLAMRSGQYKDLDVIEIRDGEVIGRDSYTGQYKFKFIEDEALRQSKEIIGYLAYFELLNGFKKQIYWSKEKMEVHALQYSQGYRADKQKGTAYTFWSKDFTGMAFKTMLRQLISKWGVMSIQLEKAIVNDQAVINENEIPQYVDNEENDTNDVPVDPVYASVTTPKKETPKEEVETVEEQDAPAEEYQNGLFGEL